MLKAKVSKFHFFKLGENLREEIQDLKEENIKVKVKVWPEFSLSSFSFFSRKNGDKNH